MKFWVGSQIVSRQLIFIQKKLIRLSGIALVRLGVLCPFVDSVR